MSAIEHFTNTIARDFFYLIAGERLGNGIGREVYTLSIADHHAVIKIEAESYSWQNIAEWQFWQKYRDYKPVAEWLAPCLHISRCGTVLIQERTRPIPHDYKLPTKLPGFLSDVKLSNYGILDGRLVCHDYGLPITNVNKRPRKVDWSE